MVDVSHPNFEWQMATSQKVLAEIGAGQQEMITVFNKIDQLSDNWILRKIMQKKYPKSYWISAHSPDDVALLSQGILKHFSAYFCQARCLVPSQDSNQLISELYRSCIVEEICYQKPDSIEIKIKARPQMLKRIEKMIQRIDGSMEIDLADKFKQSSFESECHSLLANSQRVYVL